MLVSLEIIINIIIFVEREMDRAMDNGQYYDTEFFGGYDGVSLLNDSSVYAPFEEKINKNNNLACKQFGGYLGDGKVQACLINGSGYGILNYSNCYEKVNNGYSIGATYGYGNYSSYGL